MQVPPAGSASLRRHPYLWSGLLLAAALGWVVTIRQAGSMAGMSGDSMGTPAPVSLLVFLPVWVAMMAAMMLPSIAPVVSLAGSVNRKRREAGMPFTPAAVFVAGYLLVWTLAGVGAYLLSLAVPSVAMAAPGIRSSSPVIAGLILIGAGIYEFSPLKSVCLRHCRSPLGVFFRYWRDGPFGAIRMGAIHGAICLGCCWGLMLVLLATGLMNVIAMVAVAAVIFAQKVLPNGDFLGKAAGAGLIATGLVFALAL